jgi:hypothetical protein
MKKVIMSYTGCIKKAATKSEMQALRRTERGKT